MFEETAKPSVWVDSSVVLEIDTQGDLYRELDAVEHNSLLGSPALVEYRRLRAQGSWWLAMALGRLGVTTLQYKHESLRNMLERLAPVGTERGTWASVVTWVFFDYGVFDGWNRLADDDGATLGDRARDRLIVQKCDEQQLKLITRDDDLRTKLAANAGVHAEEPEAFARNVLSWVDARDMFRRRLDAAAIRYVVAGDPSERRKRIDAMRVVLKMYRWICEPAGDATISTASNGLGAQDHGEPWFSRFGNRAG